MHDLQNNCSDLNQTIWWIVLFLLGNNVKRFIGTYAVTNRILYIVRDWLSNTIICIYLSMVNEYYKNIYFPRYD